MSQLLIFYVHVTTIFLTNENDAAIFRSTETRIVDVNTAARIWMLLPGKKASAFRATLADLFIRVLGGDETLAAQIKEIGEFQDSLPETHPLRAFRQAATVPRQSEAPPPLSSSGIDAGTLLSFLREQKEDQKEQMTVTRRPFDAQLDFQRQLAEEQREFQRQQMTLFQQQIEEQRSTQQTLMRLIERATPSPHVQANETAAVSGSQQAQINSASDGPFEQFLRHFFTLSHKSKKIGVETLMRMYTAYAIERALPRIETRRKLLLSVSRVSVRLESIKTGGRIVGWSWT